MCPSSRTVVEAESRRPPRAFSLFAHEIWIMPAPFDLPFSLHDSARQQLWPIRVPRGEPIAFYACGITPYAAPHVGHARSFVVFDALRRVLEAFGWPVRLVRNITDVDDKIIAAAAAEGTDWHTLAHRWADHNRRVFQSLGVAATEEPSVSEHMSDIVALIERLVEKKHAYAEPSGDVYFDMDTFRGTDVAHQPADALLSHRAAGRVAHAGKRHAADFALWKAAKPGEPAWPSPWGLGRPGWHVECSAMIEALFGQTLTIHGGGSDLRSRTTSARCASLKPPLIARWPITGSTMARCCTKGRK